MNDLISRKAAIDKLIDELEEIFADIREEHVDDSVCGLCEYDGAYMGESGDWCNECPGFERDDCFKLSDKIRKEWTDEMQGNEPVGCSGCKYDWFGDPRCNRCARAFQDYYEADMRGEHDD